MLSHWICRSQRGGGACVACYSFFRVGDGQLLTGSNHFYLLSSCTRLTGTRAMEEACSFGGNNSSQESVNMTLDQNWPGFPICY